MTMMSAKVDGDVEAFRAEARASGGSERNA